MAYPQAPDQMNDPTRPLPSDLGTPPPYGPSANSAEILADIDRTRGQMDHTLDMLRERLRPRNLLHEAMHNVRDGGRRMSRRAPSRQRLQRAGQDAYERARHYGHDTAEQVRDHPVPAALAGAALVGAGAAWLLKDRFRRRRPDYVPDPIYSGSYVDARTGRPYAPSYGSEFRGPGGPAGPSSGAAGPTNVPNAAPAYPGLGASAPRPRGPGEQAP